MEWSATELVGQDEPGQWIRPGLYVDTVEQARVRGHG